MRCAVYRTFNGLGRLLYVGVAEDPVQRLKKHERTPWFDAVRAAEIEWHTDRATALATEASAIATEWPLWNIKGSPDGGTVQHLMRARRERATELPAAVASRAERDFCRRLIHVFWVRRVVLAAAKGHATPRPLTDADRVAVVDDESLWRVWNAWNAAHSADVRADVYQATPGPIDRRRHVRSQN